MVVVASARADTMIRLAACRCERCDQRLEIAAGDTARCLCGLTLMEWPELGGLGPSVVRWPATRINRWGRRR